MLRVPVLEAAEPRTIECWLELIETMMPKPVTRRGPRELVGGDPESVIVRVGPTRIVIQEAAIRWNGPSHPERVGVPVADVPMRAPATRVTKLIARAHGRRISRYRWCPMCRKVMQPEHMDGSVCHGCRSEQF